MTYPTAAAFSPLPHGSSVGEWSVDLSAYVLERVDEDDEFTLYRGQADGADPRSILLRGPVSAHPRPETLKKMAHEYSLRHELDRAWAVRPLALSRWRGQDVLVFEDPGGEPLSHLIHGAMDVRRVLGIALDLATALRELHQRQVNHKDLKPSNIL